MPTHYERLDVARDADRDTIWRAYLSAVRQALAQGEGARDDLADLDAAWEVLRDDDTRAAYDRSIAGDRATADDDPWAAYERLLAAGTPAADDPLGEGPAPQETPGHDEPAPPGAEVVEAAEDEPAEDVQAQAAPAPPHPSGGRRRADARGGRRRRGARPTWDEPAARRRSWRPVGRVLGWLAVCGLAGAAAGLAAYAVLAPDQAFEEGSCVTLTPAEALPVACDSPDADATVVEVTTDQAECAEADGGWIEIGDGRYGCLALLDAPAEGGDGEPTGHPGLPSSMQ